jgi:penicillin amidase
MNLPRLLLRALLGRRLPRTSGALRIPGPSASITIRRDRFGIPVIDADSGNDAWFGLGFCHGQDRAFQLEGYLRVARGTLAELVGPAGLPIDRLSRRAGFRRAAERQLPLIDPTLRPILDAYAAGVNGGATLGLPRRAHELTILRGERTPWDAADPLAFLKLQSFVMAANWDVELARLLILTRDGPAALRALDPTVSDETAPAGAADALDRLSEDAAALSKLFPFGGASNNWAISGARTATGRPLLANDPHLAPLTPSHWYLARLRTPGWSVAGASFVGTPTVPVGHNGHAAWGVTSGMTDSTDLFLEEVGPDGASVREGERFVPCEVRREVIAVKGAPPVTEDVLVTPRGPIVSPALEGADVALSLRAVWLDDLPLRGWLAAHRARTFDEFRNCFEEWPGLPQNIVYADAAGHIGWQLVGAAPVRKRGHGTLPAPGHDPSFGWAEHHVPFAEMPHAFDPPEGFVASANNRPAPDGEGPFLGLDWLEGYRVAAIRDELRKPGPWTPERCQALQLKVNSLPWREMREAVLAVGDVGDADARRALELLRGWDGRVAADSPAASVYELAAVALARRLAEAKAPNAWRSAVGLGFSPLHPDNFFCYRRIGHLSRLVRRQPEGWLKEGWPAALRAALAEAVRELRRLRGPRESRWAWGIVRPLWFRHPLFGEVRGLGRAFNLGPIPGSGDDSTPNQSAVLPLKPTSAAYNVPGLRAVIDVGGWSNSRFALAGGQSGNPLSPHYADLLPLWQSGAGVAVPWTEDEVAAATVQTLRLEPA